MVVWMQTVCHWKGFFHLEFEAEGSDPEMKQRWTRWMDADVEILRV